MNNLHLQPFCAEVTICLILKLGSIQLNLSEGASGDFLLTLPYKTKIKYVLFISTHYLPSCNLALIDVSEKIQVIFILCFCDRIIKKHLLVLQGRLFFYYHILVQRWSCGSNCVRVVHQIKSSNAHLIINRLNCEL